MTHLHSSLARKAAALFVGVALMAPALALAEDGSGTTPPKPNSAGPAGAAGFCTRLDGLGTTITSRIPKREDKRDQHLDNRVTKVNGRFELRLGKLDDRRDRWHEDRTDRYAKLEARATTTAQIDAVSLFKTNVEAAIVVRQAAVDAAIKAFQDGVNALLAGRQTTIDAAFATLKSATDAAIAKAKADCTAGTDPATVRATLQADLKAANEAFRTAIKPSDTLESSMKSLRATRDAAVKAAIEAFQATFTAEMTKLKAAFGVHS